MNLKLRYLFIIAVATCHGLNAQAAPARSNQANTPAPQRQSRTLPATKELPPGTTVTITADTISAILTLGHRQYQASGNVIITADDLVLSADHVTYDAATARAQAAGHVAFDSDTEQTHIEGASGWYDFRDATGEFDNFHGVSGIRMRGRMPTDVANNPLIFSGKRLLRLGPRHYRLENGTVTSCTLPNPEWVLSAQSVDIELGQDAKLEHAVFRLFDVPIFYAPFLTHSTTQTGRHSGVLMPTISHSNIKGYMLGDEYYWAAAPNLNIIAGGDWYSSRGWADHLTVDSDPTAASTLGLQLDGVFDRGLATASGAQLKDGGQELVLTGSHQSDGGWRSVLDADYLSSYLYRLEFQNTFADAINSQVVSNAFSERQDNGQDWTVAVHRYQNFLGTTPTANLSLAALPSLDWSTYLRHLSFDQNALPVYISWDYYGGLMDRGEPGFSTGLLERFDLAPTITVPLNTSAGDFTSDTTVRSSWYSEHESTAGAGTTVSLPALEQGGLWRNAVSTDLSWQPPTVERVFANPFGSGRLEHVFEPDIEYQYTGGINDPNQIIRFDDRDILTDTSEVDYGFTNRLLVSGAEPGESRELASWTLQQKYFFDPTFGGALTAGGRNVLYTTEMLSPFDIESLPLRFSPLSSVLRISPFTRFDGEWRVDYDSHDHEITASAFSGTFHFGQEFVSGSQYLLRPPPGLIVQGLAPRFDQFRVGGGYGNSTAPGNSLASAVAYDATTGQLQYTTLQITHNSDCCGFSLEYRRFSLATVRRENQFLFSFNLSNVATFGNLRRQDRLF